MLRLLSLTALFFLLAATLHAQSIDTGIGISAPSPAIGTVTVTAYVSVSSGPVSATNGLHVIFQTPADYVYATLQNGVATTQIGVGCGGIHGCNNDVFASFPIQGNFGPSQAMTSIIAVQPASLTGQFAFLFRGKSSPDAPADDTAAIGSLNLVNGYVISGVEDINTPGGAYQQLPLTGSYTEDYSAGTIQLTLHSTLGTQVLHGFLPFTSVSSYGYPAGANNLALISAAGSTLVGSAIMASQIATGSNGFAGLQNVFLVNAAGHTACTDCSSNGHETGAVNVDGRLFLNVVSNAGSSSLLTAETIGSEFFSGSSSAAISGPDANGRLTATLTPVQKAFADQPTHYAAYAIDATHLYLLSLDPHSRAILLSGLAVAEPTPAP